MLETIQEWLLNSGYTKNNISDYQSHYIFTMFVSETKIKISQAKFSRNMHKLGFMTTSKRFSYGVRRVYLFNDGMIEKKVMCEECKGRGFFTINIKNPFSK